MVRNAQAVENILCNTSFGKQAQHGFDLSLKEVKKVSGSGVVHLDKTEVPQYNLISPVDGYYNLDQGVYSISFNEGGQIPPNHCGWIKSRSSIVRNGSLIESGLYDTNFECDSFGAFLFVSGFISIAQNARVAQFLLFKAEEAKLYDGQFQGSLDKK